MERNSTQSETLTQLYSALKDERDQLLTNYNSLTAERDELQTNYNSLTAERDQLQTNYNTLTAERDQLLRKLGQFSRPQGWTNFSSSSYYISKEKKTWSESRQYCRDKGADLVIINNEEEQTFLQNFGHTWIGLTDSENEGTWKWVDGTTLTTGYWSFKQPDNWYNEDCAAIQPKDGTLQSWNDRFCSDRIQWVCEKPAAVSIS
ncbi:hypothetical protein JZ751_004448 [Albula glossodonta]|uniref:C-type lectin domain-containing protein n=1 Tax=Albula glossodonta TaxID=121402 RepID=A0A8T2MPH9_9TELE|nr:hypothetical protein JZ751_004448 [Albula glossodonta]